MGACTFLDLSYGKTAKDAFVRIRDAARWENGYGGYSGTIAEKNEFINIRFESGSDPYQLAREMIDSMDPRINDKWGPCGCMDVSGTTYAHQYKEHTGLPSDDSTSVYLFFGWASE